MTNKFLSPSPMYAEAALLLVRIITGLFMVYHGWEVFNAETMKGYLDWDPFKNTNGNTMVYVGKSAELISGLLLVVGLFTRFSALIMLLSMVYIAFFIGHGIVWYDDQHPFMFVLLAIIYLAFGGGKWSLDNRFFSGK